MGRTGTEMASGFGALSVIWAALFVQYNYIGITQVQGICSVQVTFIEHVQQHLMHYLSFNPHHKLTRLLLLPLFCR